MDAECKKLITNSNVIQHKQYSKTVEKNQTKHRYDLTVSQKNETSNLNVHGQNQNISYSTTVFNNNIEIQTSNNKPASKLQLSKNMCLIKNLKFDKKLCIKLERCDRENTQSLNNFSRKLRSSTNGTKTLPFKD